MYQDHLTRLERILAKVRWELEELEQDYEAVLKGWGGDPRKLTEPAMHDHLGYAAWWQARTLASNLEEPIAWQKERVARLEKLARQERWAAAFGEVGDAV